MLEIERPRKNRFKLDMTPLVDIVFLLLIFFMLTSTFMQRGMEINLPEADSSVNQAGRSLTIGIHQNGSIEIDTRKVKLADLSTGLKEGLGDKGNKTVVIRADKRVPFDSFARVLDIVKLANVKDIAIATDILEFNQP